MRRLPIYILVDTSESMRGEPIESVKNGLHMLVAALRKDPQSLETAWLSVITFGGAARQIVPLTELCSFEVPSLTAGGDRMLGAALELLCKCRTNDVARPTSTSKGDWLPLMFIVTDGCPDDDITKGLSEFRAMKWAVAVSCAAGPNADRKLLDKITPECVVELASADQSTLLAFFRWTFSDESVLSSSRLVCADSAGASDSSSQVSSSKENELGYSDEDNESWYKRVWDGRYFQCEGCHEIYAYTLKKCPYCGGTCSEILPTKR